MTSNDPAAWIGSSERLADALDPGHAARIAAALGGPAPARGDALPPLWQWAFFISAVGQDGLGTDGHPRAAVSCRRRMTATECGPAAGSNSSGRSGSACRPSACPRWPTSRKRPAAQVRCCSSPCATNTARTERPRSWRNRTSSTASPRRLLSGFEPAPEAQWRDPVEPTSVLLFRYSAVTFNGHRIHYDHPYVTTVEGYPGLVVHGPLIATEMVAAFVRAHPQARLKHLSYRGLRPLISPTPFHVAGRLEGSGLARLWAEQDGTLAHQAELRFEA